MPLISVTECPPIVDGILFSIRNFLRVYSVGPSFSPIHTYLLLPSPSSVTCQFLSEGNECNFQNCKYKEREKKEKTIYDLRFLATTHANPGLDYCSGKNDSIGQCEVGVPD